jgi:hypothetical protein
MRAAHALGADLRDLEKKFSQPQEGRTVTPEAGAKQRYDEFLTTFLVFLADASSRASA